MNNNPQETLQKVNDTISLQEALNELTAEQKEVLLELTIREIQLKISSNKAFLKDIIDGGVGLIPILGDIFQIIVTLQLLHAMKQQLQEIDKKTLATILAITSLDVGVGLFMGPGDVIDFPVIANIMISKYISIQYQKSLEAVEQADIDPIILNKILQDTQASYKLLYSK